MAPESQPASILKSQPRIPEISPRLCEAVCLPGPGWLFVVVVGLEHSLTVPAL